MKLQEFTFSRFLEIAVVGGAIECSRVRLFTRSGLRVYLYALKLDKSVYPLEGFTLDEDGSVSFRSWALDGSFATSVASCYDLFIDMSSDD